MGLRIVPLVTAFYRRFVACRSSASVSRETTNGPATAAVAHSPVAGLFAGTAVACTSSQAACIPSRSGVHRAYPYDRSCNGVLVSRETSSMTVEEFEVYALGVRISLPSSICRPFSMADQGRGVTRRWKDLIIRWVLGFGFVLAHRIERAGWFHEIR